MSEAPEAAFSTSYRSSTPLPPFLPATTAEASIWGASLTGMMRIVLIFVMESVPSETMVVSVRETVLSGAVLYASVPGLLK